MSSVRSTAPAMTPMPWLLARLVGLPSPVKRWMAGHSRAWRYYTAACRRAGWNQSRLGWHTPTNGPFAGIATQAFHTNHVWVPMGVYEAGVMACVTRLLVEMTARDGLIDAWDIGAHHGRFSLMCAANGASQVLAVEPSASNVSIMQAHLAANPILAPRVEVLHAAVSDMDGPIEFVVDATDSAVGQIRSDAIQSYEHEGGSSVGSVISWRLDSLLAMRPRKPSLVKVDVEGAEVLVLRGAARVLAEIRPAWLIEIHNAPAGRACLEMLTAEGYACHRVAMDGRLTPARGDLAYGHLLARPRTDR